MCLNGHAVATPPPDPAFVSGLLLSEHHIQLQLPGGQKERAVQGWPEPSPATPGCVVLPKQGPCLLP